MDVILDEPPLLEGNREVTAFTVAVVPESSSMDLKQHCEPLLEEEDANSLEFGLFLADEGYMTMPGDYDLVTLLGDNGKGLSESECLFSENTYSASGATDSSPISNSSPNTVSQVNMEPMEEHIFSFEEDVKNDKSWFIVPDQGVPCGPPQEYGGGGDCILFPPSSYEGLDLQFQNLKTEQDIGEARAHPDPSELSNFMNVVNEETIGPSEPEKTSEGTDYQFEDLLLFPNEISDALVFTDRECREIGVDFDEVDGVMSSEASSGSSTSTQGSNSQPSEYNYNADADSNLVSSGNGRRRKPGTRKQEVTSGAKTSRRKSLLTSESSEDSVKSRKRRSSKAKALSDKESKRKRDMATFRYKLGPHLRIVSAVLDVTGMKNVSDVVPYEIKRRFQPTDLYRTIFRSVVSPEEDPRYCKPDLDLEEPSWEQWKLWSSDDDLPSDLMGPSRRIYHNCPFGRQDESSFLLRNGGCLLSLPLDLETEEGRPTYSPDILAGVGSAYLNVTLNVAELAKQCSNSEFLGPQQPLIIRLREPKCSALLYETGKLIVVGTNSFEEFRVAARKFARMIQKLDISVRLTKLKLHYYLGWVKLPFRINLRGMKQHDSLAEFVKHDFDIFPGMVLPVKVGDTKLVNLIFETGEILFADVQHPDEMKTALDLMYPCLRQFGY